LHVRYPNNVVVEIHVKQFQYMNPDWVNTSTPTQLGTLRCLKRKLLLILLFLTVQYVLMVAIESINKHSS